jgi:hypothetical protein
MDFGWLFRCFVLVLFGCWLECVVLAPGMHFDNIWSGPLLCDFLAS